MGRIGRQGDAAEDERDDRTRRARAEQNSNGTGPSAAAKRLSLEVDRAGQVDGHDDPRAGPGP